MKIFKSLPLFLAILFFSCQSERENKIEKINKESSDIIADAITNFSVSGAKINTDSLKGVYSKIAKDSAELGLDYAKKIGTYANGLKISALAIKDSLNKLRQDSINKANVLAQKKWDNSKAGKIMKKHPDWSKEECENIAKSRVWIGMSLDMLKYERGNPNHANPSNYGNGVRYQWCWENYTPSCFYGGEDLIITSYN